MIAQAAADLVTERIIAAVDGLADHPLQGRPGRVAGTRELVVPRTSHSAVYRVRRDVLEVLALVRQARQGTTRFA